MVSTFVAQRPFPSGPIPKMWGKHARPNQTTHALTEAVPSITPLKDPIEHEALSQIRKQPSPKQSKECALIEFTTCSQGTLIRQSALDAASTPLAQASTLQGGSEVPTSSRASLQYKHERRVHNITQGEKKAGVFGFLFFSQPTVTSSCHVLL